MRITQQKQGQPCWAREPLPTPTLFLHQLHQRMLSNILSIRLLDAEAAPRVRNKRPKQTGEGALLGRPNIQSS